MLIIEPIRRDPLLEPHEFSPAPYNPRARVRVTVSNLNEVLPYKESPSESGIPESGTISSIRYDSHILHYNSRRCFS